MDPASAIIGIVSFGFTVFRKVDEVRKAIKAAPEQLEALQDSCDIIEMFLNRLKTMQAGIPNLATLDYSKEQAHLESLCRKAKRCLEDVDGALDRVVVRGTASPDVCTTVSSLKRVIEGQTIRKIRWIMRRDDLEEISRKIRELRDALNVMLDFMHSNYLELIATSVVIKNTPSQTLGSSTCVQLPPTPDPSQSSGSNDIYSESLRCLSNCTCRCHAIALSMLVSSLFTPYIGQIYIPKRLLHAPWSSWSLCNVQTCRGDWKKAMSIVWLLPPTGLLLGLVSIVVDFALPFPLPSVLEAPRINISIIGTRRAIHWSAPIWDAIRRADLDCVRTLLAMRKASVWDTDLEGWPVFAFACYMWQHRPSDEGLQIIRYLVDAGAEAVLFAETPTYYSAHDWLVLGVFKYLLDSREDDTESVSKPSSQIHSIATLLQTNALAIDVFRSILNMDVLDALEDYLTRSPPPNTHSSNTVQEHHSTDIGDSYSDHATSETTEGTQWPMMLKSLRTRPATARECKSVFETLLGMSPLRYAIDFSPSHVVPLLSPISSSPDNEVANVNPDMKEPLLVFAIGAGHVHLIKPLIQAGVDVNQRYLATGETALHITCRRCYYASFKELTRWAGHKVDWAVKTLKGENALEAFEWGISAGRGCGLQVEEVDEWREVLEERVKQGVSDTCWKEESGRMPGAFSSEGWL